MQRSCQHLIPNASLLLSPQSSSTEIDPYTGNVTQLVVSGDTLRIQCAIKEQKRTTKDQQTSGLLSSQTLMRGYILSEPATLSTFDISEQIPIEIYGPVDGSVVHGLIDIDITINPHATRINEVAGIPFTGVMSRIGSGETPEFTEAL